MTHEVWTTEDWHRERGTVPHKRQNSDYGKKAYTVTVTIPLPPKQMHPNSRTHWRAKLKSKAEQRYDAKLCAANDIDHCPLFRHATIKATFHLGTRGKRHDADNLIAWLKASIDGLQDAGVLADDSGVTWLPPEQIYGKGAGSEKRVVLEISGGAQ